MNTKLYMEPRIWERRDNAAYMEKFRYNESVQFVLDTMKAIYIACEAQLRADPNSTNDVIKKIVLDCVYKQEDEPDNHNPERDVVMNGDVSLTAVFVAIRSNYDLLWNANVYGFGNIVSENDVDCGTFDRVEEVVLTAVPAGENYEFVRWSDGSTANPRTLVANRDYDIVAEFRHKTETRQISVDSYYGETTGSGTYHLGELVEISVIPNEGFHMVHWDDDEDETALVRRFYLDRYTPRFFEAMQESDATYHIRVVCEPEVAGTVTRCVEADHYDEHVEIDVTPAAGWRIVSWSDDGHFNGDHREFEVCEDLELSDYLEEIEADES